MREQWLFLKNFALDRKTHPGTKSSDKFLNAQFTPSVNLSVRRSWWSVSSTTLPTPGRTCTYAIGPIGRHNITTQLNRMSTRRPRELSGEENQRARVNRWSGKQGWNAYDNEQEREEKIRIIDILHNNMRVKTKVTNDVWTPLLPPRHRFNTPALEYLPENVQPINFVVHLCMQDLLTSCKIDSSRWRTSLEKRYAIWKNCRF